MHVKLLCVHMYYYIISIDITKVSFVVVSCSWSQRGYLSLACIIHEPVMFCCNIFIGVHRVPAVIDTTVISGHCKLMFGLEPSQTFPVIIFAEFHIEFQFTDNTVPLYAFCFI